MLRIICSPYDLGRLNHGMGEMADRLFGAGALDVLRSSGDDVETVLANPPELSGQQVVDYFAVQGELAREVRLTVEAGAFPFVLGGNCGGVLGAVAGIPEPERTGVVWFDAHADANTPASSPSGNLHGMPVACLLGHGPHALTALAGAVALQPADITLIGVRSVDASERQFVNTLGIEVYDMRYIDEFGMRHVMQRALEGVDAHTHLHVSFDMDSMDPAVAPGVGTPVRGGPTYRETQLCMEMVADSGALGSLDIMELNPALDIRNQTAELAVDLLESLFGKSTLMRAG